MKLVADSIFATQSVAKGLLVDPAPHSSATVFALYGDLGSGKTTFVQELGKLLDIKKLMQSPTFVIMKSYDVSYKNYHHLIHIDAYRLKNSEELAKLGFANLASDPGNLIAIEWAERVEDLLPKDSVRIYFKFIDETTRGIEVLE